MKSSIPLLLASFSLLGYGALARQGVKPARADVVFGRDVMPILGQRCFKCHGPDAATVAAGLRLDSANRAIVPGAAHKSLLVTRVAAKDPAMRMPPQGSGVKALTP